MSNITTRAGKGSRLTWNEVDANFNNLNSDKLDKVETADQTINSNLAISKPTAMQRVLRYLTAGVNRWWVYADGSAESGSNAGSNFAIDRFSDTGTWLGNCLVINRASGVTDFPYTPTVGGAPLALQSAVDAANVTISGKVSKSGDTMTGDLSLPNLNVTSFANFGPSNAGKGYATSDANNFYVYGQKTVLIGSVGAFPLTFVTSNAARGAVSTAGNFLLGATAELGSGEKVQVTGAIRATTTITANTDIAAGQDLRVTRRTMLGGATDDGATALQVTGSGKFTAGVVAGGKVTSLTAGAATGEGVEFAQLNAALAALSAEMIGQVSYFAMSAAPTKFVECAGQALARTGTYAALFAKIGTTFGAGDGSTTFNVPDLRGEFIRGWDDSRGVDSGRGFGSFQSASEIYNDSANASFPDGSAAVRFPDSTAGTASIPSVLVNVGSYSTASAAKNYARIRPRNVALLPCIRYA